MDFPLDLPLEFDFNLPNSYAAFPLHADDPQTTGLQADSPGPLPSRPRAKSWSTRVCDRCIFKKVKCDMKRPTCSRCIEVGAMCAYSTSKKKPGPARGYRRSRRACTSTGRKSPVSPVSTAVATPGDGPSAEALIADSQPTQGRSPKILPSWPTPSSTSNAAGSPVSYEVDAELDLTVSQEREILESFLASIHPSIPVFRKDQLLEQHHQGTLRRDLLVTILAVSASILGRPDFLSQLATDRCVGYLQRDQNVIDGKTPTKQCFLDNFRLATLAAFHNYHQFPGHRACMYIGFLSRKAYQYGLHQIDNRPRCALFRLGLVSCDEQIDDWRRVWWCIFCLDSYSSIASAVPFVVELETINTSLSTEDAAGSSPGTTGIGASGGAIFLPENTASLWKTVKDIGAQAQSRDRLNFNLHMATTYLVREAARLCRLSWQKPSEVCRKRLAAMEDHITKVRLALPPRYLDPSRNVLQNESPPAHHARLACLLHVHMARLVVSLPLGILGPQRPRFQSRTLEYCDSIVSVVREWDSQHSPTVDPAVCFIADLALKLLHLITSHAFLNLSDLTNLADELQARLDMQKQILLLFLHQFASFWHLPRLLIMSFSNLQIPSTQDLPERDLNYLLSHIDVSLSDVWLKSAGVELIRTDSNNRQHHPQPEGSSSNGAPDDVINIDQSSTKNDAIPNSWSYGTWEALVEYSAAGP